MQSKNSFVLESDFNKTNDNPTIYDYINQLADLKDSNYTEIEDKIKELLDAGATISDNNDLFWNESVNSLIAYFITNFNDKITSFSDGSKTYQMQDIRLADAGASFDYDFTTANYLFDIPPSDEWVLPWSNYNNKTFYEIERENTLAINGINKDSKLQFTRKKNSLSSEWLRLLMPQNNRRVEIIDLNRNFWVIAQVLSIICDYLFNDNNSLNTMLEGIVKEVTEQWENVLYLWAMLAIYSNANSSEIITMSLPIPNNKYEHQRNFDEKSLQTTLSMSEIKERFQYLIDQYPQKNLVVLPYETRNNYKSNYFRGVKFPCILLHCAGEATFKGYNLINANDTSVNYSLNTTSTGTTSNIGLADKVIGFHKYNHETARYSNCNFSTLSNTRDKEALEYTAIVRWKPTITASVDLTNNTLKVTNITINLYDVGYGLKTGTPRGIAYAVLSAQFDSSKSESENVILNTNYISNSFNTGNTNNFTDGEIKTTYYLGECLSNTTTSKPPETAFTFSTIALKPTTWTNYTEMSISEMNGFMNEATTILNIIAEQQTESEGDYYYKLKFYAGLRATDLKRNSSGDGNAFPFHDISEPLSQNFYYVINDNNEATKLKALLQGSPIGESLKSSAYQTTNGSMGASAIIYNPLSRIPLNTYKRYNAYFEWGKGRAPWRIAIDQQGNIISSSTRWHGWTNNSTSTDSQGDVFFIYLKEGDTTFKKDNWYIRMVQAWGPMVMPYNAPYSSNTEMTYQAYYNSSPSFETNQYKFIKKAFNTGELVAINQTTESISNRSCVYIENDSSYNFSFNFYRLVYKIQVDLFGPNGAHETAVYRRKPTAIQGTGTNITAFSGTGDNLEDWIIEQSTNFTKIRNKLSSQYTLQMTESNYLAKTDFEISKRTGIVTHDMIIDNLL